MRRSSAVVGLVSVLIAGGCGPADPPAGPASASALAVPTVIVDADDRGAVVFDGRARDYVGVRRDGTEAWRMSVDPRGAVPVGCLARCPDTVLSGGGAAAEGPQPVPELIVAGTRTALPTADLPAGRVLTAVDPDNLVVATGDGGRWWLAIRAGRAEVRVPVRGAVTGWQEDVGGNHAVAIATTGDGTAQLRWFSRTGATWQETGDPAAVTGVSACLAPDGSRSLLLGPAPMLLHRDGRREPLTDLDHAGTCALAMAGGIVADLSWGLNGPMSRLRTVDGTGAVTYARDLAAEVTVTADPSAARVAYVAARTLYEIDASTGAVVRVRHGVRAARYDGFGHLVVVRDDGGVAWLPA
jgi:hypothetical protein